MAGLGTFGLSDGLITRAGKAIRAGSAVVDARLEPTPRRYTGHHDWCAYYANGSCGECITRCPAGAITTDGHDKEKCKAYITTVMEPELQPDLGERSTGCGLCQAGVRCESGVPAALRGR